MKNIILILTFFPLYGLSGEIFRVNYFNTRKQVISPKLNKKTKTSLILDNKSIANLKFSFHLNSKKIKSFNLGPSSSISYPITVGPGDKIKLYPISPPAEVITFQGFE